MSKIDGIDFSGARSSNAGDEFHELWAARECLRLLEGSSQLEAIKLEGTRSSGKDFDWYSADCTMYFGGSTNSEADRVEVKQLKYSAAHPNKKWTVARISYGEKGEPSKSLIAQLAKTFSKLKEERPHKDPNSIRLSLVTNQPICDKLLTAIESALDGITIKDSESPKKDESDLCKLFRASGLPPNEFLEFAKVLDFSGSAGSRLAIENKLIGEVAEWTDIESIEVTRRLRAMVRRQMMPEGTNEFINRNSVLAQFGVTSLQALFPCPSMITSSDSCIERSATKNIAKLLLAGVQKICLHGAAGVGKTTTLSQLAKYLPKQSEMVIFDCYGGGSYLDASLLRHRPPDAFVQLSNDIAIRLGIPLLLSTRDNTDFARVFRGRLKKFANLLSKLNPEAFLLIAIDAADNSETATQVRGLSERSFIHDFMSYEHLPGNVRFIISARSGRLPELKLPDEYEKIEIRNFTLEESTENARRYWAAPQSWIDDLHELSHGIPRIQSYALERQTLPIEKRIELLKPSGKDLNLLFRGIFEEARKKVGWNIELRQFCACISVLPRPIPIYEIASVLKINQEAAKDFCIDLAPGVKFHDNFVTFSDEDTEAYVREFATSNIDDVVASVVNRFLSRHETDKYAAINVAPMLNLAKSHKHLLELVENYPEPNVSVIVEPVIREEVRTQRLTLAIGVCRDAGESERALRFVLLGAEAMKSEAIMRSLLIEYPRLTAMHALETGNRLILNNPQQTKNQGSLLLNLMAEYAKNDNFVAVRAFRRQFNSWHGRRQNDLDLDDNEWGYSGDRDISDEDEACLLYAELLESYSNGSIASIRHKLSSFSALSTKFFVQRLVQERRFELMEQLAASLSDLKSVFILVPLALAGHPIDVARLQTGLAELLKRFKLTPEVLRESYQQNNSKFYIVDTLLTGVEIIVANGISNGVVFGVLDRFLDPEFRRIDKLHGSDEDLLDAILRCVTISDCLSNEHTDLTNILLARQEPTISEGRNRQNDQEQHDKRLTEQIKAISGVYIARAEILTGKIKLNEISNALKKSCQKLQSELWRFHMSYDFAMVRTRAAESLSVLLIEKSMKMDVYEAIWFTLGNQSLIYLPKIAPRLLPHKELHGLFYEKVCEAAQAWQNQSTGSYEKSQYLMELAELLVPVSSRESLHLFNKSIEVAGDISSEIGDIILLLNDLVRIGLTSMIENRSEIAITLTQIVEDSYKRVKYAHHFPWHEALSSISRLDASIALASFARWHDQGIVNLTDNLSAIVHIATSTNQISCSVGHALLFLAATSEPEDLEKFIDIAEKQGSCENIAAEIERDLLSSRTNSTDCINEFVSKFSKGNFSPRIKQFLEFNKSIPKAEKQIESVLQRREKRSVTLDSHNWSRKDLCSGKRLKARADAIIQTHKEKKQHFSLEEVLQSATSKVEFFDSTTYLAALMEIQEAFPDKPVVKVISEAVSKWKAQNAVLDWYKSELPKIISFHFATDFNFLHQVDKRLSEILDRSGASDNQIYEILMDVIQRNSERLSANVTLAIVRIIASKQESYSAANLFNWYVNRLSARIPIDSETIMTKDAIPPSINETIARFIYAFLGDIDLRVRWRAAHVIRRLARLGVAEIIECIWREWNRKSEPVFRDPKKPIYWIAARLWLVIALSRISEESPKEIACLAQELYRTATCDKFPHVLIKAYARDAAFNFHSSGFLPLDKDELGKLEKVNQSPFPPTKTSDCEEEIRERIDLLQNGGNKQKEQRRFDFDGLDTLRYWYEPWTRIFDGLSNNDFQKIAEDWIVDKWGYNGNDPNGIEEPRILRFKQYSRERSTNDHGNLPTIEPYSTHLEWHAMWCAVGQLITSHQLANPEYEVEDCDLLCDQITSNKLTHPPIWLSDLIGVRPLQRKHWHRPNPVPSDWFTRIDDEEFLSELLPSDQSDYLVVHSDINMCWKGYQEKIEVFSAFVTPNTAHALVNTLQTVESQSNYFLGPEGSSADIMVDGFELKGWLEQPINYGHFDSKDPFCKDIVQIARMPSKLVTDSLGLQCTDYPYSAWIRADRAIPCFLYEAWGANSRDDRIRHNGDEVISSGCRLLIYKADLAELLAEKGYDLITEVGVKRHERGRISDSYDSKNGNQGTFDRILLLRGNGQIEGAERNFGSWRENCSETKG